MQSMQRIVQLFFEGSSTARFRISLTVILVVINANVTYSDGLGVNVSFDEPKISSASLYPLCASNTMHTVGLLSRFTAANPSFKPLYNSNVKIESFHPCHNPPLTTHSSCPSHSPSATDCPSHPRLSRTQTDPTRCAQSNAQSTPTAPES